MDEERTKDPAAVALGRRGGRIGGKARAAAMTPEERAQSARSAANARWALPRATHFGELKLGEFQIPCYVLENGRRVLSNARLLTALGMSKGGYRGGPGDRLVRFVGLKSINPYVSEGLSAGILNPLQFRLPTGQTANAYDATVLAEICEAILRARRAGALQKQQMRIAERAEVLVSAFARVGIIALVDEATGYQAERDRDELQKILEAYIRPELRPWQRMFPDTYYEQIFRLKNWPTRPIKHARPKFIGKLTNKLIYEQLPPGVLKELQEKNPKKPNGGRRFKHHQFLTDDIGNPHLRDQILQVVALMRGAETWKGFERAFRRAFPTQSDLNAMRQTSLFALLPEAERPDAD